MAAAMLSRPASSAMAAFLLEKEAAMGSSSQGSRQSLSGLSLRIRSTLSTTISLHLYRFTLRPSSRSLPFLLPRRLTGITPIWVSSSYQKRAVKQRFSLEADIRDGVYFLAEENGMGRFGGMEEGETLMKGQGGRLSSFPSGPLSLFASISIYFFFLA